MVRVIETIAVIAAGAVIGAGVWLVLAALADPEAGRRLRRLRSAPFEQGRPLKLTVAIVGAVAVWTVTGWPVAGLLAGIGCWWLPAMLGPDRYHQQQVERIEAVAAWTEMLRDLMAGASGLHQAITATLPIAPAPIQADVARLSEQLRLGRPPHEALAEFADDVDNPTADLVAAALSTAASKHAADLGTLLGTLAESAREQSAMLVRAAANRARVRTSTRIIIAVTLGMAVLLMLFSPDYLEPFDGFLGQLVLGGIGVLWAAALTWLVRLSRPKLGPRVLAPGKRREEVPA
ncbi:type II secretion system F family protein [Marinactinospora thermotolerans]|uniref:type II secretion system F family protein n=1 Tax=Marinactinospora thermotolerans TaxID=531310 RepID=UPI003D9397B2